jgi:hypothetical protein
MAEDAGSDLHDEFGLRPGNQNIRRHDELAAPELLDTADVGDRFTLSAPRDEDPVGMRECGVCGFGSPRQPGCEIPAAGVTREEVGIERRGRGRDPGAGDI